MCKETLLLFTLIFSLFFLESCSLSNRKYINGYKVSNSAYKSDNPSYKTVKKVNNSVLESSNHSEAITPKKEVDLNLSVSTNEHYTEPSRVEKACASIKNNQPPFAILPPIDPACDSIFLKNNAKIAARILGTENKHVVFTKCGDETEIKHSINKSEIAYVKNQNGEIITPDELAEITIIEDGPTRKIEPFSLASFITSLGLGGLIPYLLIMIASRMNYGGGLIGTAFIVAAIATFVGLILGIIGVIRAYRNREKFKGGVFAVFAIIFAVLVLLFIVFWVFLAW